METARLHPNADASSRYHRICGNSISGNWLNAPILHAVLSISPAQSLDSSFALLGELVHDPPRQPISHQTHREVERGRHNKPEWRNTAAPATCPSAFLTFTIPTWVVGICFSLFRHDCTSRWLVTLNCILNTTCDRPGSALEAPWEGGQLRQHNAMITQYGSLCHL